MCLGSLDSMTLLLNIPCNGDIDHGEINWFLPGSSDLLDSFHSTRYIYKLYLGVNLENYNKNPGVIFS